MAILSTALTTALAIITDQSATHRPLVTTDFEFRTRFESRLDKDFQSVTNDNRNDLFWRFRPGISFKGDNWSGRIQLQYAHSLIWSATKNFSTENVDATIAQLQFSVPDGMITVGRQKINLGDERLLGTLEWSNLGRSMDGIRYQSEDWDVYGFKFGVSPSIKRDARIYVVSNKNSAGISSYILKSDRGGGVDTTVHTLNHIWTGKLAEAVSGEFEVAGQIGEVGARDLSAYALHAKAAYKASPRLTFALEANVASGGQSASKTKTFDNLYPTNHKFYGFADMQGWRNMQELSLHTNIKTDPNGSVLVSWHNFWLFDATDGWYGAGGGINPRPGGNYIDPTGSSGKFVGSELDLTYNRKLDANRSLSLGIAFFSPGSFIKNMSANQEKTQVWGYGMFSMKF